MFSLLEVSRCIAISVAILTRAQRLTAKAAASGCRTLTRKRETRLVVRRRSRLFSQIFMSALSTLAALFSAFALYITYLGSGDAKWSIYIAGAFCVCIAGWQASSFFATLRLRQRLKHSRDRLASPSELREMKSAHALNPGDRNGFVGVTSVTENSTELLEHVRRPKRDTQR